MARTLDGYVGYRNQNGQRAGVGFGGEDMPALKKNLAFYIHYYVNLGYEIDEIEVSERCAHCCGSGEVTKPRFRKVKCPTCKGKNSLTRIL